MPRGDPSLDALRDVTYRSAPGDLALHGVRVLGVPAASGVAARYGLRPDGRLTA